MAGLLILAQMRVNNLPMSVVIEGMKRDAVLGRLAMVALIAITVFVSTTRPLAHPAGRFAPQLHGFTRMSLLSESPDTDSTSLPAPVLTDAHLITPPLVGGLLLLVLKTRQAAFHPLPLRRLKLPARSADRSPASH